MTGMTEKVSAAVTLQSHTFFPPQQIEQCYRRLRACTVIIARQRCHINVFLNNYLMHLPLKASRHAVRSLEGDIMNDLGW
jgi:hypothetical protein